MSFRHHIHILTFAALLFFCVTAPTAFAQTEATQLQTQIQSEQNKLKQIDAEIASYRAELSKVGAEKNTLQKALNQLDLERKKTLSDIAYTQKQINITDLQIDSLSSEISETEGMIDTNKGAIADILRRMYEADKTSAVITFLQYENVGDFWSELDRLMQVKTSMQDIVKELSSYQVILTDKRADESEKRSDLLALSAQFNDQHKVLEDSKATKSTLLAQTKNKESEYQKLLKEKQAVRLQVEKEMREYESRLQFVLNPNTIPAAGTYVFSWPVANPIITQYFGGTEFAKNNASVYAGRAYHPGIDIGVPSGTKIFAVADGVVRATGNTDSAKGCWAWGKWTLVDHTNGLSTLYAHQSQQAVTPGQSVKKGEVIGYSGNTGYSTGPHLHFTVYAKEAVQVKVFGATACASVPRPTAPTSAYIDPMNYLAPL